MSLGTNGAQANGPSGTDSAPALSADGQIVAFSSSATNLVADDTNTAGDVFVYDRGKKETTRVSVGPNGVQATGGDSYSPALSADGRYVAFASDATNLVGADDTNSATDVFVHDRQTKTTTRVSVGAGGVQTDQVSSSPSISGDGSVVAFVSLGHNLALGDTNDVPDVFLRDLKAATTVEVKTSGGMPGNAASSSPSLSADGRAVAFATAATNLVPGDTNNAVDILVFDRIAGTTERVSLGPGGAQGDRDSDTPSLSGDGRFVAFASDATNLGPSDTNKRTDIFVRDRRIAATTRVSLGPDVQADRPSTRPDISDTGRYVAFQSAATNLVARRHELRPRHLRPRPDARPGLLAGGHRRRDLRLRVGGLRRFDRGNQADQAHRRDGGHPDGPGLLAGGVGRRRLRLRRRRVLRLHRGDQTGPADRGDGGHADREGLLAGGRRRRPLRLRRRRVLRLHRGG